MHPVTKLTAGLLLASAGLFDPSAAFAQKGKPGGGGGGGTTASYQLVPLAATPGLVTSLNASGQMVGYVQGPLRATHWELDAQGTVATTLLDRELLVDGEVVSFDSAAQNINDQGLIVGALGHYDTNSGWRPVVWWDESAPARALPVPDGMLLDDGGAYAVSNASPLHVGLQAVAVGRLIETVGSGFQTFVTAWAIHADGSLSEPVILAVGVFDKYASVAIDINSSLTLVGTVDRQAMRWQLAWDGESLSVISAQNLFPGTQDSDTAAINEFGDICGLRSGAAYLLENVGGVLTERSLAKLVNSKQERADNVRAGALDNSATPRMIGAVSVHSKSSGTFVRFYDPVLWQGTTVLDLTKATSPSPLLPEYLTGINDAGWIVGDGWTGQIRVPVVLLPQ
jgi:hypothetical protein